MTHLNTLFLFVPQDQLRQLRQKARVAQEEEERFMRLAEEDPFNPEVQVCCAIESACCEAALGRGVLTTFAVQGRISNHVFFFWSCWLAGTYWANLD